MRNLNEVREALLNSTVRIVAQYDLERTTTKLIAADAQINEAIAGFTCNITILSVADVMRMMSI